VSHDASEVRCPTPRLRIQQSCAEPAGVANRRQRPGGERSSSMRKKLLNDVGRQTKVRHLRRTLVLISSMILTPHLCFGACELGTSIGYRCQGSTYTRVVIASDGYPQDEGETEPSSTRSAPPDTTPYVRPAVPEDTMSSAQPAPRSRTPECEQKEPPPQGSPPGREKDAP
jgi:hypothetical protein